MDPITLALLSTSIAGKLGSVIGQKKRKQLDPEELKRLFGAKALTDEQMELFNRAISSPQGINLMTDAAQQGQQLQTDIARRSADAGLGPAGGASGGADIFAGAASESAAGNLQRGVRANLMTAMLPIAQQLVSDRMQAWLSDRERVAGQTSKFQDIMGALGGLGGGLLASRMGGQSNETTPTSGENWMNTPNYQGYSDFAPSSATPNATPAGAAVTSSAQPTGTRPMIQPPSGFAMPSPMMQQNMPGMRARAMRTLMSGSGRFARAMGVNRFGAVQPAGGF